MRARVWLGVALGLTLLGASCFSPQQPGCAFSCATDGVCPAAYTCGSDGLCHRADGKGACLLEPGDAGAAADGATGGAAP
jgi:hypothetical protein